MVQRRFVPRRTRRGVLWEAGSISHIGQATGTTVFTTLVSEAIMESIPDPTIVRVRGQIVTSVVASAATPGRSLMVFGIKVATAAAIAGGAIELPSTDAGSDWLWWMTVPLNVWGGTSAAPSGDGQLANVRVDIDSKAMRKVGGNAALIFASQNVVVTSTQTIDTIGAVRVLLKK